MLRLSYTAKCHIIDLLVKVVTWHWQYDVVQVCWLWCALVSWLAWRLASCCCSAFLSAFAGNIISNIPNILNRDFIKDIWLLLGWSYIGLPMVIVKKAGVTVQSLHWVLVAPPVPDPQFHNFLSQRCKRQFKSCRLCRWLVNLILFV